MKHTNTRTIVCLLVIGFAFHACKTEAPKPAALSEEQLEIIEDSLDFVLCTETSQNRAFTHRRRRNQFGSLHPVSATMQQMISAIRNSTK